MQTNPFRIAFFDVDGTLLSHQEGAIPASAMRALHALRARGVKVVVATGRPPLRATFLPKLFPFDAYIMANGQMCHGEQGFFYRKALDGADINKLLAFARERPFPLMLVEEDAIAINHIDHRVSEHHETSGQPLPEVRALPMEAESNIYQFVVYGSEELAAQIDHLLQQSTLVRSGTHFYDGLPRDGGKHVGVMAALAHYGIGREDSIAFGDGDNDLTLLAQAGTGVAMGNATDTLKQVADYITTSVDDDGIANALRHFGCIE